MKLIYQFLYLICFLFFRCREKASKKKETRIKMEIVEVLQQATISYKISEIISSFHVKERAAGKV